MTFSLLLACSLGAADLNALKGIEVHKTAQGGQVIVTGSRAPIFTVFRLGDPDRLVVDMSSADAAGVSGHHDGVGPISGIVASQFSDAKMHVGRVLIALDGATKYDVKADGARLIVNVEGGSAKPDALPPETAAVKPAPAPPQQPAQAE